MRTYRALDRVLNGSRMFAPEVIGARREMVTGVCVGIRRWMIAPDRDELVTRAEPIARKAHDIVLGLRARWSGFGVRIVRIQGRKSSVGRGIITGEMAPVCLN